MYFLLEPYNFVKRREWSPLPWGPPWSAQCISYGRTVLNMAEVPVVEVWYSLSLITHGKILIEDPHFCLGISSFLMRISTFWNGDRHFLIGIHIFNFEDPYFPNRDPYFQFRDRHFLKWGSIFLLLGIVIFEWGSSFLNEYLHFGIRIFIFEWGSLFLPKEDVHFWMRIFISEWGSLCLNRDPWLGIVI